MQKVEIKTSGFAVKRSNGCYWYSSTQYQGSGHCAYFLFLINIFNNITWNTGTHQFSVVFKVQVSNKSHKLAKIRHYCPRLKPIFSTIDFKIKVFFSNS